MERMKQTFTFDAVREMCFGAFLIGTGVAHELKDDRTKDETFAHAKELFDREWDRLMGNVSSRLATAPTPNNSKDHQTFGDGGDDA